MAELDLSLSDALTDSAPQPGPEGWWSGTLWQSWRRSPSTIRSGKRWEDRLRPPAGQRRHQGRGLEPASITMPTVNQLCFRFCAPLPSPCATYTHTDTHYVHTAPV
ncbi:hypothetical protein INR49_020184 [Caranx melampygus]|nr:hypothetical protein INR49_020184 [Caranx melampygus]